MRGAAGQSGRGNGLELDRPAAPGFNAEPREKFDTEEIL
jgi:hypothetical protein